MKNARKINVMVKLLDDFDNLCRQYIKLSKLRMLSPRKEYLHFISGISSKPKIILINHQGMTSWEHAKRDHLVYDGVKYGELPIASISAKYNNTVIHITDHTGTQRYSICSCGMAGFKNARKKTQHAAERTAKLAAEKAIISSNVKTVRVKLKGAGYGRLGAIRGLVMGGMNIASVTDMTGLQFEGLSERPRAIRRL